MTRKLSRRRTLVLAGGGLAALAGCIGDGSDDDGANGGSNDDERTEATDSNGNGSDNGGDSGNSGGDSNGGDSTESEATVEGPMPLVEPAVPLQYDLDTFAEEAVNGGPGKDGIPSIDDPSFDSVEEGDDALDPEDPVFGVEIDGDARAYRQDVLVHHEIVNDTVGGRNVAVTYCPLTGTAIGFERGDVEFGVSGMLVNNNLIMYDRETDSWWPQILGTAVTGELTDSALREVRVTWTTWGQWRDEHPETQVLNTNTGFARNYGRDPYGSYNPRGGYYDNDRFLFENLTEDDRLDPKDVVIGARSADGAVAVEKELLREEGLLETTVGGVPYLAAYDPALDTGYVYRNTDELSVERTSAGYETPEGTHGAADLPLEGVNAFDGMWFAWVGFYPDLELVA